MTATNSVHDAAGQSTATASWRWSGAARLAVILIASVVFTILTLHAKSPTIWAVEWNVTNWFVARRTPTWTGLAHGLSTVTDPVGVFVIALLVGGALSIRRRTWFPLVVALTATGLAAVAITVLKVIVARPRPPESLHLVSETDYGFPSGHSLGSMTVFVTLAWLIGSRQRRSHASLTLGAAVLIAVLVGASRLYLGVHWVTDVLAAWAVAAILLTLITEAFSRATAPAPQPSSR